MPDSSTITADVLLLISIVSIAYTAWDVVRAIWRFILRHFVDQGHWYK